MNRPGLRSVFLACVLCVGVNGAANASSLSPTSLKKVIHGTFEGRLYGADLTIRVMPSGKLVGSYGDEKDTGVWKIFENGVLCLKWKNWLNAAKRCGRVQGRGDRYRIMGLSLKKSP